MDDKKIINICMELHSFLEDKEIYYPDSLFVIDVYKAWVLKNLEELRLSDK